MVAQNLRLLPPPHSVEGEYLKASDKCTLVTVSQPWAFDQKVTSIGVDATLDRIVKNAGLPENHEGLWIRINGRDVPREYWHIVRPKPGCTVQVAIISGDDDILRSVLTIGVLVAGAAISGGLLAGVLGAGFAAGSIGATVVGLGVSIGGAFAVNSLLPPSAPALLPSGGIGAGRSGSVTRSHKESQNYDITNARNQLTPYGPVPVVMGRIRIVPPKAAKSYTQIVGQDEYLHCAFLIAFGPVQMSEPKIGSTPLSSFDGVEIEYRRGSPDDAPLTLYNRGVDQQDFENLILSFETGYVERRIRVEADEIIVDVSAPALRRFTDLGDEVSVGVTYEVQYRKVGLENWSLGSNGEVFGGRQTPAALPPGTIAVSGAIKQQYRSDLVVIDRHSGALSVLQGPEVLDATPERLPTPGTAWAICAITRHGNAPIQQSDIQDLRFVPGGLSLQMAGNNDFNPTANATPNNQINIGIGGYQSRETMRANSGTLIRRSTRFAVNRGLYDVRIKRLTPDSKDSRTNDKIYWTALRAVVYEHPVHRPNMALIAIRVKANEQLSGDIDEFSIIAQSVVPAWNGTDWVPAPTSNCAALYRHVLQGAPNEGALANSRVDQDQLASWFDFCETYKLTFNLYYDFRASVAETLGSIASAGCASRAFNGTQRSVLIDRVQTGFKSFFGPDNTNEFNLEYRFEDQPHGITIPWKNEKQNWIQDELIIYADGFSEANASNLVTIEFPGVTTQTQLRKLARRRIAELKYRYKTYTFNTDATGLTCRRGDLVCWASDVIRVGVSQGYIKAVNITNSLYTSISLPEPVPMQSNLNYSVRIWTLSGVDLYLAVNRIIGENPDNLLTFTSPPATSVADINVGDYCFFGVTGKTEVALIVKSVQPKPDLEAAFTCVPYEPAIFTSDSQELPDRPPIITDPPGEEAPFIGQVVSDESVMVRAPGGTLDPRLVLVFGYINNRPLGEILHIEVQYRQAGADDPWERLPSLVRGATQVSIQDVTQGRTYNVRLRYRYRSGRMGPWSVVTEKIVGKQTRPPDLLSFSVQRLADGTREIRWSLPNAPKDFAGVEIKYNSGGLFSLGGATPLTNGLITISPYETNQINRGLWTFGAWAVDDSGNRSQNPFIVTVELGYPRLKDAILQLDPHAEGYPGNLINAVYNPYNKKLIPLSLDTLDNVGSTWGNWERATISGSYVRPVPEYGYDGLEEDVGIGSSFTPEFAAITDSQSVRYEISARNTLTEPQVWVAAGGKLENIRYFAYRMRALT